MNYSLRVLLGLTVFCSFNSVLACHSRMGNDTSVKTKVQYGVASYYSDKFVGKKTANGEIFSQEKMTAAHNSLPLGTYIRVTNLRNHKTVKVKINDRLHHKNKRLVDLSRAAAKKLGFIRSGLTRVKVEVVH